MRHCDLSGCAGAIAPLQCCDGAAARAYSRVGVLCSPCSASVDVTGDVTEAGCTLSASDKSSSFVTDFGLRRARNFPFQRRSWLPQRHAMDSAATRVILTRNPRPLSPQLFRNAFNAVYPVFADGNAGRTGNSCTQSAIPMPSKAPNCSPIRQITLKLAGDAV